MKKVISLFMVFVVLGLTACAQPVMGDFLKSDKPRGSSPEVSEANLATLVTGNSDFAFDLYQQLKEEDGNFFYSPYSISMALAMTYAGARSETEEQMAAALSYLLPQDSLHPVFNRLDLELSSRGEDAQSKDGEGFRLNIVNAIWGQQDYPFLNSYLDVLAENYGAGLRTLDFIRSPEESRATINEWVSERTENRINDLIPKGAIDALTRLVLTNAIYLNAAWQFPFSEDATSDGTFHLLGGGEVTIPVMSQSEALGYTEGEGYQAVELAYDGAELSMVILLPEEAHFTNFEKALDNQIVSGIISGLKNEQVNLSLPQFEFESEFGLVETLAEMGMPVAFSSGADFSGMTGNHDLFIGDVIHKTFVSVDEAGAEAAAATAVIMQLTAMPGTPVEVKIDRPFIFLIRDIETGAVLFLGRVVNPAA
ncbi:serpin family protein [Chloroflexota bacterium]